MPGSKRATIYLDPALHRALRLKAVETDRSISDLVGEAVRESMAHDADDLSMVAERQAEPSSSFEAFVAELRARGAV